jgi:asparagine synthase (glutamine-hydrolysing)
MCGIAGISDPNLSAASPLDPRLGRMLAALESRGPDGEGHARLAGAQIGMRRLAVTDPAFGRQPIWNEARSVALVMNGEVYNHRELRDGLVRRGHTFASASDAEVVVHLYEERGVDALAALSGMYALAIWDGGRGEILLARDPIGQRPLLVRALADAVLFASDLRALVAAVPWARPGIDPEGLDRYLAYRASVGRPTLLRGIERVLPGEVVTVREGAVMRRTVPHPPPRPAVVPDLPRSAQGEAALVSRLEEVLERNVRRVAASDVPAGILLSGGIDSGLVLALAGEGARGMPAFVADWTDVQAGASEWPRAAALAQSLGARATRVPVSAAWLAERLPAIAHLVDEPLADPTALPLYAAVRAASGEVKVLLTGEGADEMFAGYPGYREPLVAAGLAGLARSGAGRRMETWARRWGLPGAGALARARVPVHQRYLGPGATFEEERRRALYAPHWPVPSRPAEELARAAAAPYPPHAWLAAMRAVDRAVWLADEALMKLDRVAMGLGVETRAPYLEPEVVTLADALPASALVTRTETKRLLRALARRRLPSFMARTPKRGFPVPITRLMLGPWEDMARDVVLAQDAVVGAIFARRALADLFAPPPPREAARRARERFTLLMLELWLRAMRTSPAASAADRVPGKAAASPLPARGVEATRSRA